MGRASTLCCCPCSISSVDRGVAHHPRCPEGWFRKTRDKAELCELPSLDSCQKGFLQTHKEVALAPHQVVGTVLLAGDAEKVFSCIWSRKPGSFSQSQQAGPIYRCHRGWRRQETYLHNVNLLVKLRESMIYLRVTLAPQKHCMYEVSTQVD